CELAAWSPFGCVERGRRGVEDPGGQRGRPRVVIEQVGEIRDRGRDIVLRRGGVCLDGDRDSRGPRTGCRLRCLAPAPASGGDEAGLVAEDDLAWVRGGSFVRAQIG